ncbi:MAG: 30S ribosomal protein S6 [candidate division NC10 bacterium]|nr:30S ribosomal protein S6 [candidate division NC10 bacterium]
MRNYEVIVVYDPALSEEAVEGEIERVKGLIAKEGGQVQDLQKWGKKRLAYEVKKKREAVYVLCRFAAPPGALKELERNLKINEAVLRYLSVRVEERKARRPEAPEKAPVTPATGEAS